VCAFGYACTDGDKERSMGRPGRGVNGGGVAEKEAHKNIKIKTVKRSIVDEAGRRNNACPMRMSKEGEQKREKVFLHD
jgi:hypothetical protein